MRRALPLMILVAGTLWIGLVVLLIAVDPGAASGS